VIVARVCLLARLKWDLDGKRPLEFGSLISSSNWMVDERIAVETDAPLLWTTGLHQRSKDTK
jgi:thiamine pyrophosphokinase